jgi:hypothetical protein
MQHRGVVSASQDNFSLSINRILPNNNEEEGVTADNSRIPKEGNASGDYSVMSSQQLYSFNKRKYSEAVPSSGFIGNFRNRN